MRELSMGGRLMALVTGGVLMIAAAGYAQSAPQSLWLDGTPVASTVTVGHDSTKPTDEMVGGAWVERLTEVTRATVTVYPASPAYSAAAENTPAVLVVPGGGYQVLADDLEGTEVCRWLNRLGITAVLLRYRVPSAAPHGEPLEDAEGALALLRSEAAAWHVDSRRIGVIGFSAGAYLAARLSALETGDGRLAALMLIYPAYLASDMPKPLPTRDSPPAFLVQAEDDPIGVRNSLVFYEALLAAHVPAEMHLYAAGGHGYGMRPTALPVTHWPKLAEVWLEGIGFEGLAR